RRLPARAHRPWSLKSPLHSSGCSFRAGPTSVARAPLPGGYRGCVLPASRHALASTLGQRYRGILLEFRLSEQSFLEQCVNLGNDRLDRNPAQIAVQGAAVGADGRGGGAVEDIRQPAP